eukprot:TRINITY_DN717_c1_g3_i1.p2 TRINITY_DN717_c1_g3~~TRINITY_DN717_c1_g3_i1.p2  ORF type:complete len:241 (+),score=89.32 TRINITY_DN717_c1_g3_i1:73-795(+)
MGKAPLDHSVAFFDKADGRDKLFKAVQNWCKVLAWWYTVNSLKGTKAQRKVCRENGAKYRKIASSLSAYRSLNKFFKWLKIYKDIRDTVSGGPNDMSAGDYVSVASDLCDVGYKVMDNVEWLSKHKVVTYNAADAEKYSKEFQFWCYTGAIIVSFLAFLNAGRPGAKEKELKGQDFVKAMKKKQMKATLDLVKDTADFLRVAANRGIIPKLPKPLEPAFAGLMGTVSGGVGAYQVWVKTA